MTSNKSESVSEESPSVVIVARHGERLDYVKRDAGENWVTTSERPWDPPLSLHGLEQGGKLGRHLAQKLGELGLPQVSAVYSSPFLRCRQTAAAATVAGYKEHCHATKKKVSSLDIPKVHIEIGLAESINESWYRSWGMPYSDGTWGKRIKGESEIDPETLHPAAKQTVMELLDWESTMDANNNANMLLFNTKYQSRTELKQEYSFHPRRLESTKDQQERMKEVVSTVHEPGKTVLLVSHGGPVTHLFEELTGKDWKEHGESSYCCYSIYTKKPETDEWKPILVNQSQFLKEKVVHENHVTK